MRKLRAGVIGLGSFGRNHARVYSELPCVELVAVCDIKESNLELAKRFACRAYKEHREMLTKERLELVSVVVPTSLHHAIAMDVINAGVNLLVEKPIAARLSEAKEIIMAAKSRGVKLTVGHIERFNPAIIELRRRLDRNELGRVFRMGVYRQGPFPERIRDVGVVIDLAVHDLDIARYLLQEEVEHLYARTAKKIHTQAEDMLSAILTFKGGTICSLSIDWLTPAKIRRLYLAGEKGQFVVDFLKQDLIFQENDSINGRFEYSDIMRGVSVGNVVKFNLKKKEPLLAELEHFADCVLHDKPPLVSGEDGMRALELALALIKSSETNSVIRLDNQA